MRFISLLLFLASASASASTAKVALAALYTAEKAYFSEHEMYSQNLLEIGFDDRVDEWSIKAYTLGQEQRFVGVATSRLTGESWEINERKQLRQVHK